MIIAKRMQSMSRFGFLSVELWLKYVLTFGIKNDRIINKCKITKSILGFWIGFRRFYGNLALPSYRGEFSAYFKFGENRKMIIRKNDKKVYQNYIEVIYK